jgi:biotin carboxyl carrier protein
VAPPAPPPDVDAAAHERGAEAGSSSVTAPMPGTVLKLLVAAGDRVVARQPLVVLEAMKMELPLAAPFDATVSSVHVAEGDRVGGGTLLVELDGS